MGQNPAQLTIGGVFQERYEVVRCIATGGMGAVYEVVDVETKRHRALKVMLPQTDEDGALQKRFRREATVAAQVESEHIAETIDAGVDGKTGAPYLVMELLKGEDLGELIERRGALPAEEVVVYLWQASLALDKTHAASVVHRDLKPENLFVIQRDDGTPCVKLLDFGIAKAIRTEGDLADTTRGVVGTPLYISPEQVRGRVAPSGRSDAYALAQIAYTLLTGQAYWAPERESAEDVFPVLMAVAEGPPQRAGVRALERTGIELPPGFDAWFSRATATTPGDRFDSCSQLVDALSEALGTAQPGTASMASLPPCPEGLAAGDGGESGAGAGSRWPVLAAAVVVVLGLAGVASWLLRSDPVVESEPTAATSASSGLATIEVGAPLASAQLSPSASATPPTAASVTSASPSGSSPSPRPTVGTPRGTTTATRPATPPSIATGWAPPVTER